MGGARREWVLAISAYVTLMDDWDILYAALSSIAPLVDEIVVVDGAYAWMEPYFAACGRDPAHSNPPVARVLDQFGTKLRVISGVWQDEIHKRVAGFEACRHRFVLRADADEVALLDPQRIEAFLRSDAAVATADVPMMVAPDWVRGRADGQPEQLGVLFDRQRISAAQHLAHLWLIMPPQERARVGPRRGRGVCRIAWLHRAPDALAPPRNGGWPRSLLRAQSLPRFWHAAGCSASAIRALASRRCSSASPRRIGMR